MVITMCNFLRDAVACRETEAQYLQSSIFPAVAKVDVAGRTLTIISENGEDQIKYGKLLVASGADVIKLTDFGVPGADLPGIHYLRELSDAEGIGESNN